MNKNDAFALAMALVFSVLSLAVGTFEYIQGRWQALFFIAGAVYCAHDAISIIYNEKKP
jgi:hypothetical protein